MSASKNLGKVFMTPKGVWNKALNYTKLDIVTNKVGKISCGYIATTDIPKNTEITDAKWLKLFELLDGDLTEEYKAVQTDVTNKASNVNTNKKAVDLIYSQMQKLYDVEISTTTPTNERTGLWINPDDISGVVNIPEIKDDEVSDVDTWSSKKIDNVTSNKITKFYASSQGETNLQDSDDGKIMDMMIYGKSEQKQYSGKNLLNPTLQTTTQNGVTCTNNGDGTYTLNGTASVNTLFQIVQEGTNISNGTYKVTGCPSGGSPEKYFIRCGSEGINAWNDTGDGCTSIISNNRLVYRITIIAGATVNNIIFKPMLVYASLYPDATYDDFEPYTGGQPSPSPDYPQEIKSVVNPTVKVCGKNLLNATLQTTTQNGVTCTNNGDGTYTLNGTATATGVFVLHSNIDFIGKMRLCGGTSLAFLQYSNYSDFAYEDKGAGIIIEHFDSVTYPNASFNILIKANNVYNNTLVKPMLTTDLTATYDDFEPYHEQTVTLPYDLYGIKVPSGGNVIIGGQEYASDYFDVERGKLVRCVGKCNGDNMTNVSKYGTATTYQGWTFSCTEGKCAKQDCVCSHLILIPESQHYAGTALGVSHSYDRTNLLGITLSKSVDSVKQYFIENNVTIFYQLETPIEIDLTPEEIAALKALATYYPTTNISVNSEQLDGYTVFNYPISMQNGWNYVKKQIGDTRDYIYDMDARTQDTDLQAAEAYVNSEYAVALTELEV